MTCFQMKCSTSWQGSSRVRQHRGLLQPAGERWMMISFLISRSVIKWHRQAHFNQEKGAAELVDVMPWVLWWVLTHISPNCSVCGRGSLRGFEIPIFPSWCPQFLWFWTTQQISVNAVFLSSWYLEVFVCILADISPPTSLCFLCCSWHYLYGWV